jgi:CheY-like chemotaxis protein
MYRIVIVDDRATNRAIYSQLVRSLGQNVAVTAFGDAAAALDWLKTNSADLIVTDYEMPRIDGDEFITRFRALPGADRVPIMMITVCGQRQKKLRALESGATDFLRAPVDHFEFITRARNLLKLSRSAGEFPVPAQGKNPVEDGARALLERCGARDYAVHVVEVVPAGPAPDLSEALRGHLRESDFVARLDPLRYAVLQEDVVGPSDAEALARRLPARGDPGRSRDFAGCGVGGRALAARPGGRSRHRGAGRGASAGRRR